MDKELYDSGEIKMWIERAKGRINSTVDNEICALIAQTMIMFNTFYENKNTVMINYRSNITNEND